MLKSFLTPRRPTRGHPRTLNIQGRATVLAVNLIEDRVVAEKKFLQETNFQEDESEAFKADALDNFEKHYGEKKKLRDMWKNNYES